MLAKVCAPLILVSTRFRLIWEFDQIVNAHYILLDMAGVIGLSKMLLNSFFMKI